MGFLGYFVAAEERLVLDRACGQTDGLRQDLGVIARSVGVNERRLTCRNLTEQLTQAVAIKGHLP